MEHIHKPGETGRVLFGERFALLEQLEVILEFGTWAQVGESTGSILGTLICFENAFIQNGRVQAERFVDQIVPAAKKGNVSSSDFLHIPQEFLVEMIREGSVHDRIHCFLIPIGLGREDVWVRLREAR